MIRTMFEGRVQVAEAEALCDRDVVTVREVTTKTLKRVFMCAEGLPGTSDSDEMSCGMGMTDWVAFAPEMWGGLLILPSRRLPASQVVQKKRCGTEITLQGEGTAGSTLEQLEMELGEAVPVEVKELVLVKGKVDLQQGRLQRVLWRRGQ